MKKRLIAIIAALCLLVTMGAQFALAAQVEGEPLTGKIPSPEIQTTNEPQEEDPPVEVSDYDAFMTAVQNAQEGDTITVTGDVRISAGTVLSDAGKGLTLRRGTQEGRFIFEYSEDTSESTISNSVFDGAGLLSDTPFVTVSHNATFDNVNFINCANRGNGGAITVYGSSVSFINCRFDTNTAELYGGHIFVTSDATVTLDGCTLTKGHAGTNGGAIHNLSACSIISTTITGNTADGSGGGVANTGAMTITNSKIYANIAKQGGADIANGIWGNLTLSDSIENLTSIYEVDGFVPVGWVYDYPTAPITVPGKVEAPQFIPLKMTFEGNEQPPVTPEPEPTPTPTPDPTPTNPPSGGHRDDSTPSTPVTIPEPKQDTQTPLLTCGNAVLDVSRRDYLLGYGDSLAGQETHIKRSQAVTVLFRLLTPDSLKEVYSEKGKFIDVSKDDWCSTFVNTLQNAGVIKGCGGDMFAPERNLTRGEMVTLFTRFVEPRTDQSIQLDHWSADEVRTAASLKWITYNADFDPNEEVSVQEFISFTLTVLDWGTA